MLRKPLYLCAAVALSLLCASGVRAQDADPDDGFGFGAPPAAPAAAQSTPQAKPAPEQPVELEADRKPSVVTKGSCLIRGGTVITVSHGVLPNTDILIQDGKIVSIGAHLTAPAGAVIIEAAGKFVTPGIVDAHSHIAADAVNEGTDSITAEVRIRDVLDPKSIGIWRGLSNGVTTSIILHGSANAIGGQCEVIKMKYMGTVEELLNTGAPRMIKFALGENVKQSNGGGRGGGGRFPSTRMGVEAVYRRAFAEAKDYTKQWDAYRALLAHNPDQLAPRRDLRLETLADILKGNIWVQCHSYRADEMLMMVHLSQEFHFHLVLQHALEAYKILPELAAAHIPISTFADMWDYKVEAEDAIPYNAAMCMRAGLVTSVNSDNETGTYRLNQEAAKCIKYGGLSEDEAWKLITINPAIQLGMDKRVGTLDTGKDGDIAIWDGYPFSVTSKCMMTLIEGEVYFQRRDAFGVDKSVVAQRTVPICLADHMALPVLPDRASYALVGAIVHPVTGPDLPDATVLIEDGKIKAIGKKLPVPKGVLSVNVRGLHVYPGFVDAGSVLGLSEIESISASTDSSELGAMQPDLLALTAVNPASELFAVTRCDGVTTTLTRPSGGGGRFGGGSLITGQGALIHLSGWTPELMKVLSPVTLHVTFPEAPRRGGRGGRGFAGLDPQAGRDQQTEREQRLRDVLDAAKLYTTARSMAPDRTPIDPEKEALAPYAAGTKPIVFSVSTAAGIRSAIAFADSMKLKVIISTGDEAFKVADLLASKHIPVIYNMPMINSTESQAPQNEYDPYDALFATPGLLRKAGVDVCFASNGAAESKNLPTQVGITTAYGLSHDDAIKALTIQAAKILGVSDRIGSLEVGKIADVIVTDGDPLEMTSHLHYLFIAGKPIPLESKHTRLYKMYLPRLNELPTSSPAASAAHAPTRVSANR